MAHKKILALPGSLRADSSSNVVLKIISQNLPDSVSFEVYDQIGALPHFNDPKDTPEIIDEFKRRVRQADVILICTPEYAFGVPGSLKNALDWTVSTGEFVSKPVALITAASHGEKAHPALLNILTAISAKVPANGDLLISFIRAKLEDGKFKDDTDLRNVMAVIDSLLDVC
jgi:chromate reductase, NAD(P)H dehydrogenase (quinone)